MQVELQLILIKCQKTLKDKQTECTRYGLRDCYNPLQKLSLDLYRLVNDFVICMGWIIGTLVASLLSVYNRHFPRNLTEDTLITMDL